MSQDQKICDGVVEVVSHKSLWFVLVPLVPFTGYRIPVRNQSSVPCSLNQILHLSCVLCRKVLEVTVGWHQENAESAASDTK